MNSYTIQINEASNYIMEKAGVYPDIALVLGSGLGELADSMTGPRISYEDIPYYPKSTVTGHKGQLVFGEIAGKNVVVMQGRFHFYEGYNIQQVVFPIRVFAKMGIKKLFVTNAAGGINPEWKPGNLMLITDHLNLTGQNPLIGQNLDEFGDRFPDMSEAYSKSLREKALKIAADKNILLRQGVYASLTGPSYETPAEIKMLRTLGADAIGMSTVPEVICAVHSKMQVLGISCISNMAAGILDQPLSHEEVMETGQKVKEEFSELLINIVKES